MGTSEESGETGGIAWRRLGAGPPLLLINGYAASSADWDPAFLEVLASASTVICPENRGIGNSEKVESGLSIEGMAADCLAVLEASGIESADVAGWSMGGYIDRRSGDPPRETPDSSPTSSPIRGWPAFPEPVTR